MFYTTQGDLERAIYEFEKKFNLDCDGKTIRECLTECRNVCPQLHSESELKEYAQLLVDGIVGEFGFTGLRVYYDQYMKFFSNEALGLKYYNLIGDVHRFVNRFREDYGLTLLLDVLMANIYIKQYYLKNFGLLDSGDCLELFGLLNTLRVKGYPVELVDCLKGDVKRALWMTGDKYFIGKDLSDRSVLSDLFLYVAETVGYGSVFGGHGMFKDYDGYGGVVYNL